MPSSVNSRQTRLRYPPPPPPHPPYHPDDLPLPPAHPLPCSPTQAPPPARLTLLVLLEPLHLHSHSRPLSPPHPPPSSALSRSDSQCQAAGMLRQPSSLQE